MRFANGRKSQEEDRSFARSFSDYGFGENFTRSQTAARVLRVGAEIVAITVQLRGRTACTPHSTIPREFGGVR